MTATTDVAAMYKYCLFNTTKYSFSILCKVGYKFETFIIAGSLAVLLLPLLVHLFNLFILL